MKKINRMYSIVSYDKNWPIMFSEESQRIAEIIGDNILEVQHIGSTSVPGMSGKPTIDILFVVDDISKIKNNIADMRKIGYESLGAQNAENSHLFEKEIEGKRIFIVHFYQKNHPEIKQIIAIRDYLKTHKNKALEYSNLKVSLFQKFPDSYSQYRKFKDEYMENLKNELV